MSALQIPATYYTFAPVLDAHGPVFSSELQSFLAAQYGESFVPDIQNALEGELRASIEARFLQTILYRMGRIDGQRFIQRRTSLPSHTIARQLLVATHDIVGSDPDRKTFYQTFGRPYCTGIWHEAGLHLNPARPSSGNGGTSTMSDSALEAAMEEILLRFIPLWELRDIDFVPDSHIQTMIVRAADIARLRDEADRRARDHVLRELLQANPADTNAASRAYAAFCAAIDARLHNSTDTGEAACLRRRLQVPLRYADLAAR